MKLLRPLLDGNTLMALHEAVYCVLAVTLGGVASSILGLLAAFPLYGLGSRWFGGRWSPTTDGYRMSALACSACFGLMMAMFGPYLFWAIFGSTAEDISVRQAPEHSRATVFRFTDGRVLTESTTSKSERGTYRNKSGGRSSYAHTFELAPIVPEDWKSGEPVPAWAACADTDSKNDRRFEECKARWEQPSRAGLAVLSHSGDFRELLAERSADCRADSAPILEWRPDPEAELRLHAGLALFFVGLNHAVWTLGALWKLFRDR